MELCVSSRRNWSGWQSRPSRSTMNPVLATCISKVALASLTPPEVVLMKLSFPRLHRELALATSATELFRDTRSPVGDGGPDGHSVGRQRNTRRGVVLGPCTGRPGHFNGLSRNQ